jgi:hypothetical protein
MLLLFGAGLPTRNRVPQQAFEYLTRQIEDVLRKDEG